MLQVGRSRLPAMPFVAGDAMRAAVRRRLLRRGDDLGLRNIHDPLRACARCGV